MTLRASPTRQVAHHNSVLKRATGRAFELEGKLVAVLEPILDRAGAEAASGFERMATDHLRASALIADSGVRSTSTMVAVKPRPDEAAAIEHAGQPGDLTADTLHVTLVYIGDTDGDLTVIAEKLSKVAATHAPLTGEVGGIGAFGDNGNGSPKILLPDVPGLVELRVAVTEALETAGQDYSRGHGFTAHTTVGYDETGYTFPSLDAIGAPLHFDSLWVVRGDMETIEIPLTGVKPLTASAVVATSEKGLEIGKVAEEHAPDGGYGDTAWNESTGTVFWVSADWTTNDEHDAAVAAFLEVEGVEHVDGEAEAGIPDGDDWERVFSSSALTASAPPPWSAPAGDEIIDVDRLVATLRTKTDPVRQAVVETTMKTTLNGAGIAYDVTNPFTAKVLAQSGSQITHIAETTRANAMRIIAKAYEEGLSIPDTAKAIRAGMKAASTERATLIARTELAGAVNGGSLAATQIVADATGIVFNKTWLTAPGAQYPRHEDYDGLDGQTVALDEPFDVGGDAALQFPGDPDGPPEEVCNCLAGVLSFTRSRAAARVR